MKLNKVKGQLLKSKGTPVSLIINEKKISLKSVSILKSFINKNLMRLECHSIIERNKSSWMTADKKLQSYIKIFRSKVY